MLEYLTQGKTPARIVLKQLHREKFKMSHRQSSLLNLTSFQLVAGPEFVRNIMTMKSKFNALGMNNALLIIHSYSKCDCLLLK